MKKLVHISIVGILLIWSSIFRAQCPPPDGSGPVYNFTTQAEIDNFIIDYPNCTELLGFVNIYNEEGTTDPITNLNGLNNLTIVSTFQIYETNLEDFSGLNNLTEITRKLAVWDNEFLFSFTGLENLVGLGTGSTWNSLYIYDNSGLFDISSLSNVTQDQLDEININNNDSLFSVDGLANMTLDLSMYELRLVDNPNLTICSIESVCAYISGGGNATIYGNFFGCESLYTVTVNCQTTFPQCPMGDIVITTQSEVDQFLIDYPDCAVIPGILTIDDNGTDPIVNLDGFQNIETVYGLSIQNTTLIDFSGLDTLETISGDVEVNNVSLTNITFLSGFISIEGSVKILNNTALTDLTGLSTLEEIDGSLEIVNNDALTTLAGLDNIVANTITELIIEDNDNLSLCNMDSVCIYLANGWPATISGNDTGCNTIPEVEGTCNTAECPPGDVIFTTQSELDYFALQYPNCTQIWGNVDVGGPGSTINNLSPLNNITVIEGTFSIDYTGITNFEGLNNLTEIGGYFDVGYNDSLINFEGLDNLNIIGEDFSVYNNLLLEGFNGLESLATITGELQVMYNPEIVNFEGLNNLSEIGISPAGPGIFPEITFIFQNHALENLNGLENLNVFYSGLTIQENENLTNIDALNGLSQIGHPDETVEVRIQELPSLVSIQGLENITTIYGDLKIVDNPILSNILPLSNLSVVNSLVIGLNDALTDLNGLQGITEVGLEPNSAFGELNIYSNNSLTSLEGLNNLQKVNGSLLIEGNDNLNGLDVLMHLETIGSSLWITGNTSLTNLEGLNNLAETGAYSGVTNNFLILSNDSLTSIEALQDLISVGNSVISISGNSELSSLSGLDNIDPNSIFALELVSSQNLSICEVASICDFIANAPPEYVNIGNNATGCNNATEVEDACEALGLEDIALESGISLHPNPMQETLIVSTANGIMVTAIKLYDTTGKLVISISGEQQLINVANLSSGIYFISIETNRGAYQQKLLK